MSFTDSTDTGLVTHISSLWFDWKGNNVKADVILL